MHKEIEDHKCRGISVQTKKWVYGFYCKIKEDKYAGCFKEHFILPYKTGPVSYHNYITKWTVNGFVEVNPKTLGRFTGIVIEHPKGNQDIYQEDIVKTVYNTFGVIVWVNSGWQGCGWSIKEQLDGRDTFRGISSIEKVIGNITDDSDLLLKHKLKV